MSAIAGLWSHIEYIPIGSYIAYLLLDSLPSISPSKCLVPMTGNLVHTTYRIQHALKRAVMLGIT